jgi:hypothetical protein
VRAYNLETTTYFVHHLPTKECNPILTSLNLHPHPRLPIKPPVLLPIKHTRNNTILLRLFHSPLRQQLSHTFALEGRVHATYIKVPALRTIAGPITFKTVDGVVEEGRATGIGGAVGEDGEGEGMVCLEDGGDEIPCDKFTLQSQFFNMLTVFTYVDPPSTTPSSPRLFQVFANLLRRRFSLPLLRWLLRL